MKKIIFIALLLVVSFTSKAGLTIFNNTACSVDIVIHAHDNMNPLCGLHSNTFTVAPFGFATFPFLYSVNNPPTTNPGWSGGYMASNPPPPPATWNWDYITFKISGSTGGNIGQIACTPLTSLTIPNACGGLAVTGSWTPVGPNFVVSFDY